MGVYLITGTSRGLGEALAARLAAKGHRVTGFNRTPNPRLREAAGDDGRYDEIACDLSEPVAAAAVFEAFLQEAAWLREADEITLVHNAGVLDPMGPAEEADPAAQQTHLQVNLTAPLLLTSAFIRAAGAWPAPHGKRVVSISSGAGRKPYAGWSAYCSAKAGLDMMTRCIALEQGDGPGSVKLASIAPGVVDTGMQETIRGTDPRRFPDAGRFVKLKETGSLYTPEEAAARLAAWLESGAMKQGDIVDVRELAAP
ncbi:SDR family NAD(P)-dependent oxidoreductase [Paenibacillus mucilaginosus]|uniref:Short-chain dehydrogenase n=2 Tax=Paenibacillus mucilaginosus TaxID=61624 RepID=I0BJQ0_9BACL|nr:SDR family NAD(P)-dependent oxidoreductase [Paenibacillus mucilaginosus]AEI41829.1 short chain dehydrogenase [Paenibacillus mucilaginosus KNP414]AFH62597.2 short-chain dehydrogenase [Paenibacillus mucilaginosus K02]MCG7214510.1 SDR family NAD(P)-dependent oxidoreductase [Paenibacillus mucilaginosus]WDM30791.1 SDR family NAD(P)-dependent oxidoreductase [Paenibacillus mucilaginosus]WFA18965.1 SDR family NAD(P)-dependent oxidoreductase [Paenibacillus mucilaginosus]